MRDRLFLIGTTATLLFAVATPADAGDMEVGALVGVHEPLDQDDATNDMYVGLRIRVPVTLGLKFEIAGLRYDMDSGPYRVRGIPQEVQSWTMSSVTAGITFGGTFGTDEIEPFATIGSGVYLQRKSERPDTEQLGIFGSLGLNLSLREEISADIAGSLTRVNLENGGSRALVSGHVAINYHLGLD